MYGPVTVDMLICPSPREAGRGRDPTRQRWEGEVCFRGTILSDNDTHLTRSLRDRPLPPQAGGEVLCPTQRLRGT
jgi:hypothetical protein